MIKPYRSKPVGDNPRGQTIVLFALCLMIILGMAAVAVDGGYGLVQERRAQNGADFGSFAGTRMVAGLCKGGNPPANSVVYAEIQSVIDQNSPDTTSNWVGHYLDSSGADTGSVVTNDGTYPPLSACGVRVVLNPQWTPYIANILGKSSLQTTATASSVSSAAATQSIGIVALDEVNPHQVLGGGSGNFDVFGTIFSNSTVPYHPWDGTRYMCSDGHHAANFNYAGDNKCKSTTFVDVVDAKDGSSLVLHGTMQSAAATATNPIDWCFGDPGPGWTGNSNGGPPNVAPLTSPHTPDPYNDATSTAGAPNACGSVTLKYDLIQTGNAQIADPLAPAQGGVNDPFQKSGVGAGYYNSLCPGEASPTQRTVPASPDVNGVYQLSPGEYSPNAGDTAVVLIGKKVHFNDCGNGYPGVYRFDKGLDLRPGAGQAVTGDNVMIATSAPVPEPGNVPGSFVSGKFVASGPGNGAPCFPQSPAIVKNSNGGAETDGTHQCGGTAALPNGPYYGVITNHIGPTPSGVDNNTYGTGTNFSAIIGATGTGSVTITGPNSGLYRGIVLFQDRATEANFGLNSQPGDNGTVTLTGVVYNASQPCLGYPVLAGGTCSTAATLPANDPYNFWDVGIPFRQGGVLQAGLGTGTGFPNTSGGSVTVNGPCVVGDFNTDGGTTIKIDGRTNTVNLAGVAGSGNPPLSG